jgi:hypothetical protein
MKMYITILEWVPTGHALNTAAHAGLIGYLNYKDLPETKEWLESSFKKVTCVVSEEEFEQLTTIKNCSILRESRLDGAVVGAVFAPRLKEDWPEIMKTLRLWR